MNRLALILIFFIFVLGCRTQYKYNQNFISEIHSGKELIKTSKNDTSEIFVGPRNYTYLKYNGKIEFKIIGYEPAEQVTYGNIQGLPTGVFIGKTYDKNLPDTITILAIDEMRQFKFGQKLFATPDKENDSTDVALWIHIMHKYPRPKYILGTKYKAFLATVENKNK